MVGIKNENYMPVIRELNRPDSVASPYKAEYKCDVVVVGCGFAGLNAAVNAKEKGKNVLVIDKGRPGYSGLAPWPNSFRWFDPDKDDAEAFRKAALIGGEYITNMNWYEAWIQESKKVFHRLMDWGIIAQYPKAEETGDFFRNEDFVGYRETFEKFDRHQKWIKTLERYDIPWIEHTMITETIVEDNCVKGVMGFHVPSGQVITVHAKAVILATGGGCYKPSGFPVGGNTFDGEYMAYKLGLPITGKEFEDSHGTSSVAPGNPFYYMNWAYLENIWLCGGDASMEEFVPYVSTKATFVFLGRANKAHELMEASDGSRIQYEANTSYMRRAASRNYETDPDEIRSGKMGSPMPASDAPGGAIGMSSHLTAGVLCDLDDMAGSTGIGGLFVAGDGIHATLPGGAAYPCGRGFTSCFCSIDGMHAGDAAADYASNHELKEIRSEEIASKTEEITAPFRVDKGLDPNWARDILHNMMAPYWISMAKTEKLLESVLVQVEYMRDNVIPNLQARTGHDLRLCHEMRHKILSAEMKLRASLARKESRGATYRQDYPYRDDKNFLCYITLKQGEEGMELGKVAPKPEWTGDTDEEYTKRYIYYFPGEPEAIGFTPPPKRPRRGRGEGGSKR